MNPELIAQQYHDRIAMSMLTMEWQICGCCGKPSTTTTSIEHDSRDYSKDMNVCPECYSDIVGWWEKNSPFKVAPI